MSELGKLKVELEELYYVNAELRDQIKALEGDANSTVAFYIGQSKSLEEQLRNLTKSFVDEKNSLMAKIEDLALFNREQTKSYETLKQLRDTEVNFVYYSTFVTVISIVSLLVVLIWK
jgi:dsDNA-specific endonuclease/ATPase MutS2